MPPPLRIGALLVGHGSERTPSSMDPVRRCVAGFDRAQWSDVRVGSYRNTPSIADAVAALDADAFVVIPFALANGWFATEVVPREVEAAAVGRPFVCSDALGVDPRFADVAASRFDEALAACGWDAAVTALLLAAHGTPRNVDSGATVRAAAAALHERASEVAVGFLDDTPETPDAIAALAAQQVVIVPWFLADGAHPRRDLPAQLDVPPNPPLLTPMTVACGGSSRSVVFTSAVGEHPTVGRVAAACAADARSALLALRPSTGR